MSTTVPFPLRPLEMASPLRIAGSVVFGLTSSNSSSTTSTKRPSIVSLFSTKHQSRPALAPSTATSTSRSEPCLSTSTTTTTNTTTTNKDQSPKSHNSNPKPNRKVSIQKRFSIRKRLQKNKSSTMNQGPPENVLQWLEVCCPNDVVPKVLAFCGPQMVTALMGTNRYWFELIAHDDSTWRTLCEGMYKWNEDHHELPTTSWKEYYRTHPCVPIDYPSIPRALATATSKKNNIYSPFGNNSTKKEQKSDLTIMLRPGKHYLKEAIVITASQDVNVAIETMQLPSNRFYSARQAYVEQEYAQSVPEPSKSKSRNTTLRQFMGCKSDAVNAVDSPQGTGDSMDYPSDSDTASDTSSMRPRANSAELANRIPLVALMVPLQYPTRAKLVMQTRKHNEPLVRVTQGKFSLSRVDLEHGCLGVDIWNGNAAVQVQPAAPSDNDPPGMVPRPAVRLDNVAISSKSGRGLVCLDGGYANIQDCMIYDCAATGLYVGGPGSEADIRLTDVVRNGIGSRMPPSRMARVTAGHSGVYLEQGMARIEECNISSNCLTGISAVSHEKAFLHLSKSELVANGQGNLEVPPPGTLSYDKSEIAKDNNMASVGRPCLRSNLELPAKARVRASF